MFLFLPFFGQKGDEIIKEVSLLSLTGTPQYIKIPYLIIVFGIVLTGVLLLALQNYLHYCYKLGYLPKYKKQNSELRKDYDYILIDCMPSLGMMTINALAAADSLIVPLQPSYLSTKGLDILFKSVSRIRKTINPTLRIDGILLTMVDSRTINARNIISSLKATIGQNIRVFDTEIPHSVRAVECALSGGSIYAYDIWSACVLSIYP